MKPRLCCSLWDIAVGWALPRLKHDKLLSRSFEVPRRSLQHSRPLGFNMCVLRSHEGLAESFLPYSGLKLAPKGSSWNNCFQGPELSNRL